MNFFGTKCPENDWNHGISEAEGVLTELSSIKGEEEEEVCPR